MFPGMRADPYRHPRLYDIEYADLDKDITHYVGIARRRGGPLLELGVGNGRIALPVARTGAEVHGVDRSADMLADLRRKVLAEQAEVQARVRFWEGDFRRLEAPTRYPTVFWPFNTLHHCESHTDLVDALTGIRRALLPDGRLFLDCYLPDPALYARDPDAIYGETTFNDPVTGEEIESWERSWYDPLRQVHHVTYSYYWPRSGRQEDIALDLRVFYPQELKALVDWGGFDVIHAAGGFHGGPVRADSRKWVAELRPRD